MRVGGILFSNIETAALGIHFPPAAAAIGVRSPSLWRANDTRMVLAMQARSSSAMVVLPDADTQPDLALQDDAVAGCLIEPFLRVVKLALKGTALPPKALPQPAATPPPSPYPPRQPPPQPARPPPSSNIKMQSGSWPTMSSADSTTLLGRSLPQMIPLRRPASPWGTAYVVPLVDEEAADDEGAAGDADDDGNSDAGNSDACNTDCGSDGLGHLPLSDAGNLCHGEATSRHFCGAPPPPSSALVKPRARTPHEPAGELFFDTLFEEAPLTYEDALEEAGASLHNCFWASRASTASSSSPYLSPSNAGSRHSLDSLQ